MTVTETTYTIELSTAELRTLQMACETGLKYLETERPHAGSDPEEPLRDMLKQVKNILTPEETWTF